VWWGVGDVMTRVNYLRVDASSDLPPNVLDVYQQSFDTLTKEMVSNPVTYTKERFTIIESELRTQWSRDVHVLYRDYQCLSPGFHQLFGLSVPLFYFGQPVPFFLEGKS